MRFDLNKLETEEQSMTKIKYKEKNSQYRSRYERNKMRDIQKGLLVALKALSLTKSTNLSSPYLDSSQKQHKSPISEMKMQLSAQIIRLL